jgi:hypothetical protein
MKIRITVEERQARVILAALDIYSRIGTGQLERIEEFIRDKFWDKINADEPKGANFVLEDIRHALNRVKALAWKHPANGSYSIHNDEVPQDCRESFDIIQVLRRAIAVHKADKESVPEDRRVYVLFDRYHPTNPDWPPVEVEILEE